MMKPRSNRIMVEQTSSSRNKAEPSTNGSNVSQRTPAQLLNQQPNNAQQIRKRRSSINVYDQPSSLNSRLRQLETDMLRLDEDRTKLFDDTHSALTQYELKLGEIHAILKSRQDSVEKYVEDMKTLLLAKEEFERQTKLLNEKNERIHEKFMHRETTISREIKLLKNKFELLEKNRQFRSILQKSSNQTSSTGANMTSGGGGGGGGDNNDDLASGLDSNDFSRTRSEATSEADSYLNDKSRRISQQHHQQHQQQQQQQQLKGQSGKGTKNVRIKLSKIGALSQLLAPLLRVKRRPTRVRRKSNKISSISSLSSNNLLAHQVDSLAADVNETGYSSSSEIINHALGGGDINHVTDAVLGGGGGGGGGGGENSLQPQTSDGPDQQAASSSTTIATNNNNKKPAKSKLFGRLFR